MKRATCLWLVLAVLAGTFALALGCAKKEGAPSAGGAPVKAAAPAGGQGHDDDDHGAIPEAYASLVNPCQPDADVLAAAGTLYGENCLGCHGVEGKGDGPKARTLEHTPADLSSAHFAEEMDDAAIYWRITEGMEDEDMPSFKDNLSDEQRWQLVCFVRKFAAKPAEEGVAGTEAGATGADATTADEHAGHDQGE